MRYLFGGLIFGGAYFRNFTVLLYYTPFSPRSRRDERERGQARHPLSRPPLLPSLVFVNSKTDRSAPPPFMNTAFIPHVSNAHVLMSIAYLTLNISFARSHIFEESLVRSFNPFFFGNQGALIKRQGK